jgi:hypothetical protein
VLEGLRIGNLGAALGCQFTQQGVRALIQRAFPEIGLRIEDRQAEGFALLIDAHKGDENEGEAASVVAAVGGLTRPQCPADVASNRQRSTKREVEALRRQYVALVELNETLIEERDGLIAAIGKSGVNTELACALLALINNEHARRTAAEAACEGVRAELSARANRERTEQADLRVVRPEFIKVPAELDVMDPGFVRLVRFVSRLLEHVRAKVVKSGGVLPDDPFHGVKYGKIPGFQEALIEVLLRSPTAVAILAKALHFPDVKTVERWLAKRVASLGIRRDHLLNPTEENVAVLARIAGVHDGEQVEAVLAGDHTSITMSLSVKKGMDTQSVGDLSPEPIPEADVQMALADRARFCETYRTRLLARGVYAIMVCLKRGAWFPVALKFTRTCAMNAALLAWQGEVIEVCVKVGIMIKKEDTGHAADRF